MFSNDSNSTCLPWHIVEPYIYSFSSLLFPFFLHILPKALTFPMFFSLLPPFNYPSLWSCALSHKVKVDGLCREVHPDLHNVATFSLSVRATCSLINLAGLAPNLMTSTGSSSEIKEKRQRENESRRRLKWGGYGVVGQNKTIQLSYKDKNG